MSLRTSHDRFAWIAILVLLIVGTAHGADTESSDPDDPPREKKRTAEALRLANYDNLQPPPAADPTTPVPSRSSRSSRSSTYARLSRAPNMFGDSQLVVRSLQGSVGQEGRFVASFGANAVGSRKIAENEKVLPMDRVFASYNQFQGVTAPLSPALGPPATAQLGRTTIGFEKTFLDGDWSFETRLAASSSSEMQLGGLSYDGGTPGALTFYLKNLLYSDDLISFGGGIGVSVPIASDVMIETQNDLLRYREETIHLMPYVGFLAMPDDDWFLTGFAQIDLSTGRNQLDSMPSGGTTQQLAEMAEQNLLFFDLSLGRWLYRDEEARALTGLAAVVELHYITTTNDSSPVTVTGPPPPLGPTSVYTLTNLANRLDVLNLTAGLQFQLGQFSNLRVAGVAPLSTGFNQLFDSELQISFNRMF